MNFRKSKDDVIGSIGVTKSSKFKADGFDETELKQLENDSANLLNSIGTLDIGMNRDLSQLKELLAKNLHDGTKDKSRIREGNGRRLLASEKFNHGLVENQLMNLKQDLNIGAKVGTRKIYRVKREHPFFESPESDFKNLVEKLKKRATQYELDYVGREDKRLSDHKMYMGICADIQDEFRKFEGKHKMDFDSFLTEEIPKNVPALAKSVPRDLKEKEPVYSPFSNRYEGIHASKHDTNTKSLLEGYFKVIQKVLEDAIFTKTQDVYMMDEFYQFEKRYHNMDDSFEQIWAILKQIFEDIGYTTTKNLSDNPDEIQRKLCRNTCAWFENEFCNELQLNEVIREITHSEDDDDYTVTDDLLSVVIDRILDYMKDFNYETDESKLELEDNRIPIYAIIYFCVRAGKRREAVKIASRSLLPEAKIIYNLLQEEVLYFRGSGEVTELSDNEKLYHTALQELSTISRRQVDEGDNIEANYKKDIFKEALLILLTKHITPSHPLLNSNLSDYLWFNLQKCYFERPGMEFKKQSQDILTLKVLQATILSHGDSYFNEDGSNPLNFYKVLILVGLYEEAVRYLDTIDKHRIENTHVAICLNELGIIGCDEDNEEDMKVDSFTMSRSKKNKDKKKRKLHLMPQIIKNFIEFLGPEYFNIGIIYASMLEGEHIVDFISDLFVKHNSFSLLLESTQDTGLNLINKKNLPLSILIPLATLEKIIHKVSKKVSRAEADPHICILLQNKIGNYGMVVELIIQKQNQLIDGHKPNILQSAGRSFYSKDVLMNIDKTTVPKV